MFRSRKTIPVITLVLVAVNVFIFILMSIAGLNNYTYVDFGAQYTPYVMEGEWWRLFTAMFLHTGVIHIIENMIVLFYIGGRLESEVGRWKYLLIYLAGGLFGNLVNFLVEMNTGDYTISLGASGAIFALFGILLVALIKKINIGLYKSEILIFVGIQIYATFATAGVDIQAHLGGLAGGFIIAMLVVRKKT